MIVLKACDCPEWPELRRLQRQAKRAQSQVESLELRLFQIQCILEERKERPPSKAQRARRVLALLFRRATPPERLRRDLEAVLQRWRPGTRWPNRPVRHAEASSNSRIVGS